MRLRRVLIITLVISLLRSFAHHGANNLLYFNSSLSVSCITVLKLHIGLSNAKIIKRVYSAK